MNEKDAVRKGQVIAELRADDLRSELEEARASPWAPLLVKVALGEETPLKLGQRVEVEIGPEKVAAK